MANITINTDLSASSKILRRTITGVSINAAATDVGTFSGMPAKWRLRKMTVYDASADLSLSSATLGLYTGPGATGSALAALAALTALTSANKTADMTLASVAGTDYQTGSSLYIRCGVAHGSAATVTVAIEIEDLT